ncbi:MAG TPA: hypothetical protein VKB26_09670 [Candidatus Acidoferrales bacterium]|nr:hypothetical protein [Candidatus Acidoferrales bacterium]
MRLPALVATVLAALLVAGCASTLSPLYLKTDAVADPAIVGSWLSTDKDNPGSVRVEAMKNGSYRVSMHYNESGDDAVYEARLVKLGSASFADLILTKLQHSNQNLDLPWGAVPLHEIAKYQVTTDDLAVFLISNDALSDSAQHPGFPLRFQDTKPDSDCVITSTTDELRRYFSAHSADIFREATHLKRQH